MVLRTSCRRQPLLPEVKCLYGIPFALPALSSRGVFSPPATKMAWPPTPTAAIHTLLLLPQPAKICPSRHWRSTGRPHSPAPEQSTSPLSQKRAGEGMPCRVPPLAFCAVLTRRTNPPLPTLLIKQTNHMAYQEDIETVQLSRMPVSLAKLDPTGGQSLPRKPLADLPADLTDTPLPESGVRMRRIRAAAPLTLLLLVIFISVQMIRPLPEPSLTLAADSQYTFEGGLPDLPWPGEGQAAVEAEGIGVMGVRGTQTPAPIASVAKTMTAYVILQSHPLSGVEQGPLIEVDQLAENESHAEDESTAKISKGQRFTEKQMLQLLMIPSGNNAARLLARWDSGSEEAFVKKMNDAAKALGMNDTTYTDPSGLKATTVSTAIDQLKLAKAVLRNDVFREIVDTPQIEIPGIPGTIYNNNGRTLLQPGVHGIKTGSSTPAGGNLLWSANTIVDGKKRRIVGAVFGIHKGSSVNSKLQGAITHSITLIRAAQKSLDSATVVSKGDVVGYVNDGLGGHTPVVATKDLQAIGWPGLKAEIRIMGDGIPHSAPAGAVVGTVSVGTGAGMVSVPVALHSELDEPGMGAKLAHVS